LMSGFETVFWGLLWIPGLGVIGDVMF
jgi:hypothetical protein